jgi:hypothetical protein
MVWHERTVTEITTRDRFGVIRTERRMRWDFGLGLLRRFMARRRIQLVAHDDVSDSHTDFTHTALSARGEPRAV